MVERVRKLEVEERVRLPLTRPKYLSFLYRGRKNADEIHGRRMFMNRQVGKIVGRRWLGR